ncbi:hypothetical protein OS175_07480 [Marinicella sp. S1101]|uniref:hypothetical protein n=1 Tax=Marinicella marina TaxID=2996016 RepID=UPI002260C26B|nr:hypothetical protein [Marinicella marina]MCX7553715.1 hypothetical protein [Marinicella marina]
MKKSKAEKTVHMCCAPSDVESCELIVKKFYRYKLPRGIKLNYTLESVIFKFVDSSQQERGFNSDDVLLVFCSSDANKIEYQKIFSDFIIAFKQRGNRIIPLIVNGEPNCSQNECFPNELRTNGDTKFDKNAPLALDIRPGKSIKKSVLKLQASLLDIDYELLRQRNNKRKQIRNLQLLIVSLVIVGTFFSAIHSILYPSTIKKISNEEINSNLEQVQQKSLKQQQKSSKIIEMLTFRIAILESFGEKDNRFLETEYEGIIFELSKLESGTNEKINLISYAGEMFYKKFRWANAESLFILLVENINLLPNEKKGRQNIIHETHNKIALNQLAQGKIQSATKTFQYLKKVLPDEEYSSLIRKGYSSLSKVFNENILLFRDEKYLDWLKVYTLYSTNILPKNINHFQLANELFQKSLILDKTMKKKAAEEFFIAGLQFWKDGLGTKIMTDKYLFTSMYNKISTYSTFTKNYSYLSKEIVMLVKSYEK